MKRITLFFILTLITSSLHAETLLNNDRITSNGLYLEPIRLALGISMLNADHSMDDISGLGSSHETPDLNQILIIIGLKMGTF